MRKDPDPGTNKEEGEVSTNGSSTRAIGAALLVLAVSVSGALADEPKEPEKVKVGYDKGFYLHTENFSLKIGGRLQVRFTQLDLDGFAADEDSQGNFEIQRARLSFGGHFYKPTVKYYLQYDLRGEAQLTDAGLVINDDGDGILEPGEISVSRLHLL